MSDQRIRAIFFDLDGTLVSFNTHRVPQSASEALRRAKQQGLLLFVATGRHPLEVRQVEGLDLSLFSGFVTQNGQYCYTGENLLYHKPIPRGDVQGLVALLEEKPAACLFNFANEVFLNLVDDKVLRCHSHISTEIPPIGNMQKALEEEVYQLVLYGEYAHALPYLEKLPHCVGVCSNGMSVDIYPREGGKEHGIQEVLRHFGIAKEEVMAVGDGSNDLGMLAYAGLSVAMANAPAEVRAAAGHVCPSADEGGIAYALERFVLR